MFYLEKNGEILFADDDRQRLENTIGFLPQFSDGDIREGELAVGYDGKFYLPDRVPEKPLAQKAAEVREVRDRLLASSDKMMLNDYPITDEKRQQYRQYRQYLRDLPAREGFPELEVKTFEQWRGA